MAQRLVIILLLALALASVTLFVPPAQAQALTSPCAVAAATALAQRGAPYIWGSKGPSSFDCSGLVYYAWVQAGYDIGLSTYDQARAGVQIRCGLVDLAGASTTCWQAGDLIFLRYTGGQHVSMYIGNGLFADAYNPATGVIIHDVSSDPFYQDNYWQSRRIVSCNGVSVNPGSSSHRLPDNTPGLEDLPALLAPVSFTVIQCGACTVNGSTIMPATSWDGEWPSNPLDVGGMVQSSISWLSWRVSEMLRILICWLLSMLAILASILAALANVVVAGINGLWRLMLQFWFAFQGWMTELSYLLDALVAVVFAVRDLVAWIIGLIILVVEIGLQSGYIILLPPFRTAFPASYQGWLRLHVPAKLHAERSHVRLTMRCWPYVASSVLPSAALPLCRIAQWLSLSLSTSWLLPGSSLRLPWSCCFLTSWSSSVITMDWSASVLVMSSSGWEISPWHSMDALDSRRISLNSRTLRANAACISSFRCTSIWMVRSVSRLVMACPVLPLSQYIEIYTSYIENCQGTKKAPAGGGGVDR